jgi:NAD(P)-dependent dehydrogenase (short-subunit alcohol dehydrogenase family)
VAGYRRGLRLPGSVVVVTGAAGPAGRAVAIALAGAGAQPVLVDAASAELDGVAGLCADRAVAAPTFEVDVADPDAVLHVARRTVERHGRLDGWVQCAGAESRYGGLVDLPLAEVRRVLDVDLLGAVHGARAALPAMIAQGGGVLVVVASLHGQVARPYGAVQGMAGAAVRVMAAALREELRLDGVRGVAVTAVLVPESDPAAPAFLRGRPERVASTVLRQLRRPRLEKVAAGPLTKAVVHGHALVPAVTERLLARPRNGE